MYVCNVCMYVCVFMNACMYVFMYIDYVCVYVCIYVCMYDCMYVCMYICMRACIYLLYYMPVRRVRILSVKYLYAQCRPSFEYLYDASNNIIELHKVGGFYGDCGSGSSCGGVGSGGDGDGGITLMDEVVTGH